MGPGVVPLPASEWSRDSGETPSSSPVAWRQNASHGLPSTWRLTTVKASELVRPLAVRTPEAYPPRRSTARRFDTARCVRTMEASMGRGRYCTGMVARWGAYTSSSETRLKWRSPRHSTGRGAGTVLILVGEAGTGKTTLIDEARSLAGVRGVAVLHARCSEVETSIPFDVIDGSSRAPRSRSSLCGAACFAARTTGCGCPRWRAR